MYALRNIVGQARSPAAHSSRWQHEKASVFTKERLTHLFFSVFTIAYVLFVTWLVYTLHAAAPRHLQLPLPMRTDENLAHVLLVPEASLRMVMNPLAWYCTLPLCKWHRAP